MLMKKIACAVTLTFVITTSMSAAFADTAAVHDTTRAASVTVSQTRAAVSGEGADESKAKISRDKAKEIAVKAAKEYFDTSVDESRFQTDINFVADYTGKDNYVWSIRFNKNDDQIMHSINVEIGSDTGRLLGFSSYKYVYGGDNAAIPKITKNQAKKIADEFAKKINAGEFSQSRYVDYLYRGYYGGHFPENYAFTYSRVKDGIYVDSNYISIGVNAETGKVSQYGFRWNDDAGFPGISNIIKQQEAFDIVKQKVGFELVYMPYSRNIYGLGAEQVKLAYTPDRQIILDAETGKFVDWQGNPISEAKVIELSEQGKTDFLSRAREIKRPDKEMDKDKAAQIMKTALADMYGKELELQALSYQNGEDYLGLGGIAVWTGIFQEKSVNEIGSGIEGNIGIDALSGQVVSLYKYNRHMTNEDKEFVPAVTWEQAYYKALDMVAKCYPDKLKHIQTEHKYSKNVAYYNDVMVADRIYDFNFERLVNGIRCTGDGISVSLDAATGELTQIRSTWRDAAFPDSKKAISAEKAKEIFFQNHHMEPAYAIYTRDTHDKGQKSEIRVIYRIKAVNDSSSGYSGGSSIDAITQELLNFDQKEDKVFDDKIRGYWGEDKLSILAFCGIIDIDSFKPDESVTRLDAVKMLVMAKGYDPYDRQREMEDLNFNNIGKEDMNYRYLQAAVKLGIIENKQTEFKGDEAVSRKDMAQMLVRLSKYDELAKAEGLFALPYQDCKNVAGDKIGYISIAKALGIAADESGKIPPNQFRPDDNATYAQFAVAVYNALKYIR
ncbi:S-layer family protein [Anaerobacterium chartisolvens]|uniref:S-layer family protein n=2 Tax=Anaerobacterium chartisolvens TaxID=1297424 RepID=A0A369AZT0_9FIRM|nr:S-layer family protein [Anaerobacterium chartisolvens]